MKAAPPRTSPPTPFTFEAAKAPRCLVPPSRTGRFFLPFDSLGGIITFTPENRRRFARPDLPQLSAQPQFIVGVREGPLPRPFVARSRTGRPRRRHRCPRPRPSHAPRAAPRRSYAPGGVGPPLPVPARPPGCARTVYLLCLPAPSRRRRRLGLWGSRTGTPSAAGKGRAGRERAGPGSAQGCPRLGGSGALSPPPPPSPLPCFPFSRPPLPLPSSPAQPRHILLPLRTSPRGPGFAALPSRRLALGFRGRSAASPRPPPRGSDR